jgi:hypothetical protein
MNGKIWAKMNENKSLEAARSGQEKAGFAVCKACPIR